MRGDELLAQRSSVWTQVACSNAELGRTKEFGQLGEPSLVTSEKQGAGGVVRRVIAQGHLAVDDSQNKSTDGITVPVSDVFILEVSEGPLLGVGRRTRGDRTLRPHEASNPVRSTTFFFRNRTAKNELTISTLNIYLCEISNPGDLQLQGTMSAPRFLLAFVATAKHTRILLGVRTTWAPMIAPNGISLAPWPGEVHQDTSYCFESPIWVLASHVAGESADGAGAEGREG